MNEGDFEESGEMMDMYGNNVRVPRRIESFSGKDKLKDLKTRSVQDQFQDCDKDWSLNRVIVVLFEHI